MASFDDPHNEAIHAPYNSRITKIYLHYLRKYYPDVDIDSILEYAEMTKYAVEDQGHWFSQRQVDRFHKILVAKTGKSNIAHEAGRYAASSEGMGPAKQYTLGLMKPTSVYLFMEKLYSIMSRAATVKAKKLGSNKVEIVSTPKPGVDEKRYQCENRIGTFESLGKLFTQRFANVEHPSCFHRGDDCCRYIITWEKTSSLIWKVVRNYFLLLSILASLALFFVLPSMSWAILVLLCAFLTMIFSFRAVHLEKKELAKTVGTQGDAAKDLLDEINIRYNNALVIQEIGQATSRLLDIQELLKSVMEAMEKRLDFDRGGIWLANSERTRLVYNIGYGYNPETEESLRNADFHLDRPRSKGPAVEAFRQQKPSLVNDISEIEKDLSERSLEFVKRTGAQSFICAPVIYEGESLGVLFVDNLKSRRPLSQSDMSLLMGIAPQVGVSIHNAMSYQKLQESKEREQNLRELFEKYVPAPIIKQYVDSGKVGLFRGRESSITSLFLDIRGFTSSSEDMDARDVVSFLNDYFERCSSVISKEHGHINKYTGDGFLAIFGAPEPLEHHTALAFNAACKILELSQRFILGGKPLEIGVGIHTGRAILGNIGSQTKIEYTAVGDTVNIAARLQEFTKLFHEFPIIMSRDVWKELAGHPNYHAIRNLGMQKVRGKKEKLEAFGTLASGIVHGFKDLLMGIQGDASLMLLDIDSNHPHYERLKNIERSVQTGAQLTRGLIGFPGGGKYEVEPININESIEKSSRMFGQTKKEIKIHGDYQKDIWTVEANRGQIEQALLELYVNAWQAAPGGGELGLRTENVTLDENDVKPYDVEPGNYVKISVTNGGGVDEATRQRILEPFSVTKDRGGGTGLGLAFVCDVIKNHGGIINVHSKKGGGAASVIYLPASEKEIAEEGKLPGKVLKGKETILLVDDEETSIHVGQEILMTLGYKVLVARSGKEAVELYKANKDKIDMVILDMIMPDMGGGDTYDRMKEINPDIKVLLSSGYIINGQVDEILEAGCNGSIQKPFNVTQLSQKIRGILGKLQP